MLGKVIYRGCYAGACLWPLSEHLHNFNSGVGTYDLWFALVWAICCINVLADGCP